MELIRAELELIYQLLDRERLGLEMALPEARATDHFLPEKTARVKMEDRLRVVESLVTKIGGFLRENWQEDINDDGSPTGRCPKCDYRAHYELDAKLKLARWTCQNPDCSHAGPWEH